MCLLETTYTFITFLLILLDTNYQTSQYYVYITLLHSWSVNCCLEGGKKDLSLFLCMGQTLERTTFISDRFISVTSLYCATVPQKSICVLSLVTISCSAFLITAVVMLKEACNPPIASRHVLTDTVVTEQTKFQELYTLQNRIYWLPSTATIFSVLWKSWEAIQQFNHFPQVAPF